jgi:hypothetical protein
MREINNGGLPWLFAGDLPKVLVAMGFMGQHKTGNNVALNHLRQQLHDFHIR